MSKTKGWEAGLALGSIVLLVLGLVFSIIALLIVVLRPDVGRDFTSRADGVVTRVETKRSSSKNGRSRTSYVTHVKFEDSDHRSFEAQSVVNGEWLRHKEGDQVVVRYNPNNPGEGVLIEGDEDKLDNFNAFGSFMGYGGIAALVLGAVGMVVFFVRLRSPSASST